MSENRQGEGTFLPDFCNARTVFVIILLAELLAMLLTLSNMTMKENRVIDLALHSLFIQWVALSCTAILCIFRGKTHNLNDHWVATSSYIITLLVTYIIAEASWYVLSRDLGYFYIDNGRAEFISRVMAISAIVWALALRYFYVQHQWRRRIQSESEARFQALQSRIKPHFLFNCMNTIASLIRRNPDLAEQSVEDLADLFRASLQNTREPCTLSDEIALCQRYLRIEKHRLGERLQVDWELDDIDPKSRLPVLSLQPLLENAIYHGIEPYPEGGTIRIRSKTDSRYTRITIQNPLPKDLEHVIKRTGNKLAQDNIRERLAAFFDQENLLKVEQDDHNYRVTILIPHIP